MFLRIILKIIFKQLTNIFYILIKLNKFKEFKINKVFDKVLK